MGSIFGNSQYPIEENRNGVITITPKEHESTIIFLHGLGDTSQGWLEVGRRWSAKLPKTKIVLPTAPEIPVTLNMGMRMPAWYDITTLAEDGIYNAPGIELGQKMLNKIYQKELEILNGDHSKIIIGGFSMGGALALFNSLSLSNIGGILVLSGYIITPQKVKWECLQKDTSILMCHGMVDFMVPYKGALQTRDMLKENGFTQVELKTYEALDHGVNDKEISDTIKWLKKRLYDSTF